MLLAYYVEWHMRSALAPVLFDDHDRAAGEQQRGPWWRTAQHSPAAQQKAASSAPRMICRCTAFAA